MKKLIALCLASSLAHSQPVDSVHIDAGEVAPITGQLVADAEFLRRERINERNAGIVAFYEGSKANVSISKPTVVAIVAGSLVVGAALGVAVAVAARR